MSKIKTKFNPALQREFPFLKIAAGNDSEVSCNLCNSKFSVAFRGRTSIADHIKSAKHIKSARQVQGNRSVTEFIADNPAVRVLQAQELTFAYHAGKHQMSGPTTDCTSRLVAKFFQPKFSGGYTKMAKLVEKVNS